MKLLVFAHIPPPHHGQSYMVKLMLDGFGGDARGRKRPATSDQQQATSIECYHFNAQFPQDMEDIGVLRSGKIFLLLRYCAEAVWCRFRYGVTNFYYIPAPGKRTTMFRDWLVMALCRPFFKRVIFHWHALGLGDWLHDDCRFYNRWVTHWLMDKPDLSLVPAVHGMRDALWFKSRRVEIVPDCIPDPCPDFDETLLPLREARLEARKALLSGAIPSGGTLSPISPTFPVSAREPEEAWDAGGSVPPATSNQRPATSIEDACVFRVLHLAPCTKEKGLFDLIEGLALANDVLRAKGSHIQICLTVAGSFQNKEDEHEFHQRILRAGLTGAIVFLQPADPSGSLSSAERLRLLREADCLAGSARDMTASDLQVLIEGLAFGIPIIGSAESVFRNRWGVVGGGIIPAWNAGEIAEALCEAVACDEAEALRMEFCRTFSPKAAIERLRECFSAGGMVAAPPKVPHAIAAARRRIQVLQIFNRYEQYGGEEGSVYRIGDAMQEIYDVEYFLASSREMLDAPPWIKARFPLDIIHNPSIGEKLERYQEVGKFQVWQIHNVFPAMSPIVYERAFRWGIPVVHYLHNYRFGCTNGFLLNHGVPCERCIHGNFWPAFFTAAWRNSHVLSGAMGAVLAYTRSHLKVFENVAVWIALSEAQKAKHVEMGIPAERIHVLSHFYEPRGEPPPPKPSGYALFLGRLSAEKGVMNLLQAWEMLGETQRELVIAGDGPELPRLQQYATEHFLDNVRFVGFVPKERQRELWAGAAFSLAPSIWLEPFGMVVLEAWANNRPVIANRIGALPELVEHDVSGMLANPDSPADLAACINRAFASPNLIMEMGLYGRGQLGDRFSRQRWLGGLREIYSHLNL